MEDTSKQNSESQQNGQKILTDNSSTGKKRKWSQYKKQSLSVADAYRTFEGDATFSKRMDECGAWLRFLVCQSGHGMLLVAAIFCQCRLCPLCQWRRSLIMFHQVKSLAHEHIKYFQSDISLLLTLTVPNVPACGLSERLGLMQKSWHKLMKRNPVKRVCRSWFRALEITYNVERDDYHPHFHVLIMVPMNYFAKQYDLIYILTETYGCRCGKKRRGCQRLRRWIFVALKSYEKERRLNQLQRKWRNMQLNLVTMLEIYRMDCVWLMSKLWKPCM